MYIELISERVLCVCLVLRVHCTFDGDGGSKLQSRSCLSCVFSIIVSNMHFFQGSGYRYGSVSLAWEARDTDPYT